MVVVSLILYAYALRDCAVYERYPYVANLDKLWIGLLEGGNWAAGPMRWLISQTDFFMGARPDVTVRNHRAKLVVLESKSQHPPCPQMCHKAIRLCPGKGV